MNRSRERWIWWILLFAALPRLWHISAPPIGHHGWRQADTAAVARNFHQGGHRLFFPQVDWETPGYVEMELPLYPWAVSLAYAGLGERIWLARAASVAASLVAIYFLFLLARRYLDRETALWAAFLWAALPLAIFYGRAVMPESWMIAASVAGVYYFGRWAGTGDWRPLVGAAALVALAGLLKLTSLCLGLPLLWLAGERLRSSPRARRQLAGFATCVAAPIGLWYWHAYRLGAATGATFGIFSGSAAKAGRWDLLLEPYFYQRVFGEFFAGRLLTWVGLAIFLLGLFLPRQTSRERLFDWWLAGAAIVLLLASGGSYHHEYYALPLLVPAVVHMGRALAWIRRRSPPALTLILTALMLGSAWRAAGYLALENPSRPRHPEVARDLRVAQLLSSHTAPSDLVVSCDQTDPTWFYLSRRRGWGRACEAMDKRAVDELRESGARFLVARHADLTGRPAATRLRRHLLHSRRVLHDDGEVFLVDLTPLALSRLPRRPLLGDDFDDASPPGNWLLETGRWREQDGWLNLEPARRQLGVVIDPHFAGCELCGLRVTLSVEPVAARQRRKVLTLSGWRTPRGSTDASFDFSNGRLILARTEAGAALAAASGPLPSPGTGPLSIELAYDGFDFQVHVDSRLLLSLPAPDPGRPFGGFRIAARSLRVRLGELLVFEPESLPEAL